MAKELERRLAAMEERLYKRISKLEDRIERNQCELPASTVDLRGNGGVAVCSPKLKDCVRYARLLRCEEVRRMREPVNTKRQREYG